MRDLSEDVINLIQSNICKIQKTGRTVDICSADNQSCKEFIKGYHLEEDQGLYDRLIIEYNGKNPNNLLIFWPSPSMRKN